MVRRRSEVPDDIKHLLNLVDEGRVFAIEKLVSEGGRVCDPQLNDFRDCPLEHAVARGAHSTLEVLLRRKDWSEDSLGSALESAMHSGRLDLVDLLLSAGADVRAIDFADVCRTVDLALMDRFLRLGVDPGRGNAFARALDEIKARPLLAFYKSHQEEFPELHRQASLALAHAVDEKKHRWTALLRWAGADPMMEVPADLYHDWNFERQLSRTAAIRAVMSRDGLLVKSLKLRPNPEEAQELLRYAAFFPSRDVFEQLVRVLPDGSLNAGERKSCSAVEYLVDHHGFSFGPIRQEDQDAAMAATLEYLLERGARWNPEPRHIGSIRRSLGKLDSRYVVRVLRLLIYTPGAADPTALAELLRTPSLKAKVAACDSQLAKEIPERLAKLSAGDT
jgi:hypothetical protein